MFSGSTATSIFIGTNIYNINTHIYLLEFSFESYYIEKESLLK